MLSQNRVRRVQTGVPDSDVHDSGAKSAGGLHRLLLYAARAGEEAASDDQRAGVLRRVPGALALFIFYPERAARLQERRSAGYMPLLGVTILLWLVSSNLEVILLALGDVRASSVFIVISQLTKSALTVARRSPSTARADDRPRRFRGMLQDPVYVRLYPPAFRIASRRLRPGVVQGADRQRAATDSAASRKPRKAICTTSWSPPSRPPDSRSTRRDCFNLPLLGLLTLRSAAR